MTSLSFLFLISCHFGRELLGRGKWSPRCDAPGPPKEPVGQWWLCLISAIGRRVQRERSHCGGSGEFKEGLLAQVGKGVGDGEAGLWGQERGATTGNWRERSGVG